MLVLRPLASRVLYQEAMRSTKHLVGTPIDTSLSAPGVGQVGLLWRQSRINYVQNLLADQDLNLFYYHYFSFHIDCNSVSGRMISKAFAPCSRQRAL